MINDDLIRAVTVMTRSKKDSNTLTHIKIDQREVTVMSPIMSTGVWCDQMHTRKEVTMIAESSISCTSLFFFLELSTCIPTFEENNMVVLVLFSLVLVLFLFFLFCFVF